MRKRSFNRPKKPLYKFEKDEELVIEPRVKSAPPINTVEPEPKVCFKKADGTPLTIDDLDLTITSDEEEAKKVAEDYEIFDFNNQIIEGAIAYSAEYSHRERLEMLKDLFTLLGDKSEEVSEPEREREDPSEDGDADTGALYVPVFAEKPEVIVKGKGYIPLKVILAEKSRKPVPMAFIGKFDDSGSNYKITRGRKDTFFEIITLELNRVAMKNYKSVATVIKQQKIEKISDMKMIAKLMLSKAINEPTFVDVYALVTGELKSCFRCKEELSRNISQTAFFGTIITDLNAILEEKIRWKTNDVEISPLDFEDRFDYEEKLEEIETERYARKNRTLGALSYLANMYIFNVITPNRVIETLNRYIRNEYFEYVEAVVFLLEKVGQKLLNNGNGELVNKIINVLKNRRSTYENRIKFKIDDMIEIYNRWSKPVNTSKSNTTNRFAALFVENDVESEPVVVKPVIKTIDHSLQINSLIKTIDEDFFECIGDDEEEDMAFDNFIDGTKKYGLVDFTKAYFIYAICRNKKFEDLIELFKRNFTKTNINKNDLNVVIDAIKKEIDDIKIDSPAAGKNFDALITKLKDL